MYHVLLPVDTDEDRARLAARTVTNLPAAAAEIAVTILNVQREVTETDTGGQVTSDEWYDPDDYPESVHTAQSLLEDAGIEVTLRRDHADPAKGILSVANEPEIDHIVMSGRKQTPVGKVLFGSVTQSVLLNASVPVTLAPYERS
jgi:nucleotide-binding universal stress UspA family protein